MVRGGGDEEEGGSTTTADVHEAVCCTASIALQAKDVLPTGNSDPDGGEHVVVIGCTPPLTVGRSVTDSGPGDVSIGDGHEISRAGDGHEIVKVGGDPGAGASPASSHDGGPVRPLLSYDCTTK